MGNQQEEYVETFYLYTVYTDTYSGIHTYLHTKMHIFLHNYVHLKKK
jgi:hypothetical protein